MSVRSIATRMLLALLGSSPGLASVVARAEVAVEPQVAPTELRWEAPPSCPSQSEVRARVDDATGPLTEPLQVEVTVQGEPSGNHRATVVLRGSWGETNRELRSPTCDTLVDAVALLARVSVQHGAAQVPEPEVAPPPEPEPELEAEAEAQREAEPRPAEPPTEPEPEAVPSFEPTPRADLDREDEEPSRVQGLVRAEVRLGGGILPQLDAGAASSLGVGGRWFRAELGGAAYLPRARSIADQAEISLRLWTLQARGCVVVPLRAVPWLQPLGCGGLEAGALRGEGRGQGLAARRVASRAWVAATLGPGLALRPWRRFGFVVGGTLVVPLRRLRYTLGSAIEVYSPAAVAGRGYVGVEVHFP